MNNTRIKPVLSAEDGLKVMTAARDDGHFLISPTHKILKGDEIIGGMNLCKLPMVHFWMHSTKAQIRDSLMAIEVGENILAANGQQILFVLNKPESPFAKIMGRIGYTQWDTMTVNYKLL